MMSKGVAMMMEAPDSEESLFSLQALRLQSDSFESQETTSRKLFLPFIQTKSRPLPLSLTPAPSLKMPKASQLLPQET